MQRRLYAAILLALLAVPAGASEPSRLVVVIIFDQFRADYLDRFQPYFGPGGFNRFLRSGCALSNAHHQHSITATAPGFASIGSGLPPSRNGIVANEWLDRNLDRIEYSLEDEKTLPFGGASRKRSPVNLLEDSLGDRVIERFPQAKVIGVGLDDRTAITPAGKRATAAYWWDHQKQQFVSSSYYHPNAKVLAFNGRLDEYLRQHSVWELSDFIPRDQLDRVAFDPPELRKYKSNEHGIGVSFPHPIGTRNALLRTPFGIEMLFLFALHTIEIERLGTDDWPDLLFIGVDPTDQIGHDHGPDSYEIADAVVRTDRYIAAFVDTVEKRVRGRLTVAISADHGVQPLPEVARARGQFGQRFDFRGPTAARKVIGELTPNRKRVETELARRLGYEINDQTPIANRMIREYTYGMLYLNWTRIRELNLDGELVKRTLRDILLELEGVRAAFTNTELMTPSENPSEVERAARLSFHAERSGDVMFTLKPGYIARGEPTGTTHREAIPADQHVPLLLWGRGIKPGVYPQRVAPSDLAKTLGTILGVSAGGADSIVLPCLEPRPAAAAAERGR